MRQKNERNIDLIYSSRTQDRILDRRIFYDQKFSHITIDWFSNDLRIKWL